MQSNSDSGWPKHVAIIMDGNGRWATERGLSRSEGHRQGARNIEPLLDCAAGLGVRVLTLYAFSSDNWRRPEREVSALMDLFAGYLDRRASRCRDRGVKLQIIGRRDRLPATLLGAIDRAERLTRRQRELVLRVAIDYSSRWAIAAAAARTQGTGTSGPDFRRALAHVIHSEPVPDPDLVVRTGGEQRLSDFLLWECAYSELSFSPLLFPEFGPQALREAVDDFRRRQRRFGGLGPKPIPKPVPGASPAVAGESPPTQPALEAGGAGAHSG